MSTLNVGIKVQTAVNVTRAATGSASILTLTANQYAILNISLQNASGGVATLAVGTNASPGLDVQGTIYAAVNIPNGQELRTGPVYLGPGQSLHASLSVGGGARINATGVIFQNTI